MTRSRPKKRLSQLVTSATEAFIAAHGYQRTQMDDVARRLGVAKGTIYLSVESKEALFDLCVRYADTPSEADSLDLQVKSPPPGSTIRYVAERLATNGQMQKLGELIQQQAPPNGREELETVVRLLYEALSENRRAIKLVDVAAVDHPELAGVWHSQARGGLLAGLTPYVEKRVAQGMFLPSPSAAVSARYLIETCVTWAVHRHWDPAPQDLDENKVEDTVVQHLIRGFVGEARP